MRALGKRHLPIMGLVGVAAVAAGLAAQERPDRSKPPIPGPIPTLHVPTIQKRSLDNGLAILIVEQHKVPVVEVQLVLRAGGAADPPGQFGLASLTATMLDEGAGDRNALAIADAIDYLGAKLETYTSFDASTLRLYTPVAQLAEALPIAADLVRRPTFPASELERVRKLRLTSLLQARDRPGQIARFAFSRVLYGKTHRYGTPDQGTPETVRAFTVKDLHDFHQTYYRPGLATLLIVGDVTPDTVLPLVERAFGTWSVPGEAPPVPRLVPVEQPEQRHIYLIDTPGAAQSEISIGWIGAPRRTPDFFTLEVLNTVLGGTFSSRLNQNLRETNGYSYGAGSAFVMRRAAGPFVAAAAVQTDKTAPALTEFFNELRSMRAPVPAEEFARSKDYLALRFPQRFETTSQIARRLAEVVVHDLDESQLRAYVQRVQSITTEDVLATAKQYIQPDKFAVIIAGDRQAIERDVRALNLGPVTTLSVTDVMGPP